MYRTIALSIAIVLFCTSISYAAINVTEINWMGSVESQFAEWFELYNDSDDAVNLDGWKLYEGGGSTLVFTLTKSISAKGYLLVERTTATSPDPVPGIDDESGSFGGAGFSNSGEYLVLKDAQGTVVQSLDFSSGWPAGDVTTKQTMQWDGTKWITAPATPKAPYQNSGGEGGLPLPTPSGGGVASSAPKVIPHIELSIPKTIYATIQSEYDQRTFLDYGNAYTGVFLWNMGDGTIYKSNNPAVISHTYKYPGVYTIAFAYYKAPYEKKPFLLASEQHEVVAPTITLKTISGKGFEFSNSGNVAVDISGWIISLTDKTIELPPFTIIAPKKSVLMPFSSFGLAVNYSEATLQTPERIAINSEATPIKLAVTNTPVVRSTEGKVSALTQLNIPTLEASAADSISDKNNTSVKSKNIKTYVFIGGLIIVIGLFVLVERFIGSKKEEF